MTSNTRLPFETIAALRDFFEFVEAQNAMDDSITHEGAVALWEE